MTALEPQTGGRRRPAADSGRAGAAPGQPGGLQGLWRTVMAYLALVKPRVIELLLFTTVPTMVLAAGGLPPLSLVGLTLVGGTLAAGSANTLNCVWDRDIDAVMARTRNRPLVTGQVNTTAAVVFGLAQGALSVALLWFGVNPLSALLAAGAILFYVLIYTMVLKRRTEQNIVWGGAAGCMPVLIGWAAVTNQVSWAAIVLFGIIFLWTPPHYWPLSMRYQDDYCAADVPMLGATKPPGEVARQIIRYTWAMVACSLLLIPVAGMGWIYGVTSVPLGAWFLVAAYRLRARAEGAPMGANVGAMHVFHLSITYLTLLFAAVAVDPLVLGA